MTRLCIVLSILGLLVTLQPVAAAEPPLAIYASLSTTEVLPGGTFSATLAVYSTSADPLSLELDTPTPIGMTLLSTRWSTDTIQYDKPVTITLAYRVDQIPPDGRFQIMAYTVKDGAGHLAARWVQLRVGTVDWTRRSIYLPLVRA